MPATQTKKGDALIGVIIALAIFTILSAAVVALVFNAYDLIAYTKAQTTAQHLATEKVEYLRNLPYDDLGTQGGIPSGAIPQNETVSRNGLAYSVKTSIVFVDDPFDGVAPNDLLPTDYKRLRIDVSWGGVAQSRGNTVTFISDVAPKGVESTSGTGTIFVQVFDSNSQPVEGATVQIESPEVNPPVNLNLNSNADGQVVLPGAPVCNNCYRLTVSKEGFSSERTYSLTEIANPEKADLSVFEADLSEIYFNIDKTSTLSLSSSPGQTLIVRGEKLLGRTEYDEPIYKFEETITADASGTYLLEDLEWDNYHFELPQESGQVLAFANPLLPLSIAPGTQVSALLAFAPKTDFSLRAIFVEGDETPIASVSAQLLDGETPIATESSGIEGQVDFGQIFINELKSLTYHLVATASGYLDFEEEINITGNNTEKIYLNTQ